MARKFCKNYQGMFEHEACKVGIAFASLEHHGTKEFQSSCPCFSSEGTGDCPHKEYPTAEEMKADDERIKVMIRDTGKARNSIVDFCGGPWKMGDESSSGEIDCPVCDQAKALHFRRSGYNGHIHAKCKTENCVSWME